MNYTTNALAELKAVLESNGISFNDVDCANIYVRTWDMPNNGGEKAQLKLVFDSEKDSVDVLTDFLKEIEYDPSYGCQELYGVVLTNRNSWLERGEYDGSEWWEYRKIPTRESVLAENFSV